MSDLTTALSVQRGDAKPDLTMHRHGIRFQEKDVVFVEESLLK